MEKLTRPGNIFKLNPVRIIVTGYGAVILLGTLLLSLPAAAADGAGTPFLDTLFTATSAVCVTGLVTVDTYNHWSLFGQTIVLSLFQVGGLGFMTVATLFSFALRRRISFKERLVIAESLNQYNLNGIVKLTRRILLGTLMFEIAGAIILSIKFVPEFGFAQGVYNGVFHAVSAFCNAGFDLMGKKEAFGSLLSYTADPLVTLTLMFLIVTGGLGFAVWDDVINTRRFRRFHIHTKLVLVMTAVLLMTGFTFFLLFEHDNVKTLGSLSGGGKILGAAFQAVTTRTAGFNTLDQTGMNNPSVIITLVFMFIGGSPGSTAGGIKTTTAGVVFLAFLSFIRGKDDTEVFRRRLSRSLVTKSFVIASAGLMFVVIVTVIISATSRVSFVEAVFEAFSAFGTVGLSMGITPDLSVAGKIAVILTMLLGRVGVLTMALALAAGNGPKPLYRYREGKVMVG